MYIVVSKKENVQVDEQGEILYDDEGVPLLNDDEDVGILVKTHPLQAVVEGIIGFVMRAEVYWNLRRSPSPALEDPENLVWLSVDSGQGEEDVEDQDDDNQEEGQEAQEFESDEDQNFTQQ